jgi:hypothetical protein
MGDHKRKMLAAVRDVYGGDGAVDILLVDDSEHNVATAVSMGFKGVHVKSSGRSCGIDTHDLSRIEKEMESLDFSKKCIVALDFDLTLCKVHLCDDYCNENVKRKGNDGTLNRTQLMKEVPVDILVECARELMSFYTKKEPSAKKARAVTMFSTPAGARF